MLQRLLPLIPDGASQINDRLSVVRENGHWTYFWRQAITWNGKTSPGTDFKLKYSSAAQTADPIQASYQNPGDPGDLNLNVRLRSTKAQGFDAAQAAGEESFPASDSPSY